MTHPRGMRRTALVFAVVLLGCGGRIDPATEDASVDSGTTVPDTRPTPVPTGDPPPEFDAMPPPLPDADGCYPGDIETQACGACGKRLRYCDPSGSWKPWKACQDEIVGAECKIGDTNTVDCGNCGKQKDFCDPVSCTWVAGSCAGEGPCAPGDVDSSAATCTVPGETRIRTCTFKCTWGPYGSCAKP
jgi:hypothetical protein